jgi:hypothetical protein
MGSHYDAFKDKDQYAPNAPEAFSDISLLTCLHYVLSVPHEFTSVPFPVKALKILTHDLQAHGDSAIITSQGNGFNEVDSDDDVSPQNCLSACEGSLSTNLE